MAKKFLLLNLNKFKEETAEKVLHKPLLEIKKLATHDFTADEFVKFLNDEGNIQDFIIYSYEIEDEVTLKKDDWYDITVNDQLGVHIKRNEIGYSVDLYNVHDLSDDGFFSSVTVFNDDFINEDDDG